MRSHTPSWRCLLGAAVALAPLVPGLLAQVYINEIVTSNGDTLRDENGDSPDWIELFNAGPVEADLSGYGLSDNPGNPFKWTFNQTRLTPGQFLVVFASGKDRQPGQAIPINPTNVSGLACWLRADRVETNDSTQVRRSGAAMFVRRWTDQSGSANHASQSVDLYQPILSIDATGRPAMAFDGNNDFLTLPQRIATNDFCFFAVFRTARGHESDPEANGGAAGVAGQRYLFGAQHGGEFSAGAGLSVGTNGIAVYEHGSNYMPPVAAFSGHVGTGFTVVGVNYQAARATIDFQGLLAREGLSSARAAVWAPVEIGAGNYGAFGGSVLEILFFNRSLTSEERRGIAQYLAGRHSLEFPSPLHTNFQLSSEGEDLLLTAPTGTVADSLTFGPIPRDVSQGRQPDGTGPLLFFESPTPGRSNSTPGSVEFLTAPSFSHSGGFYTNAFPLALAVAQEEVEIRYTLDGSEPSESSKLYTGPISITSRFGTPNTIANIPTVPGGPTPAGEVFKGWVVRAKAFKAGAFPSRTVTRSFWVHSRGRARYTVPIISLATDRANFFDPAIGIYVPGNAPGGNYSQRGEEWERPVHVEFYEPDNALAFAQEADVKIHGNTSQNFPIKGLDLDGTGGQGRRPFSYPIFPERKRSEFEHFLLRPTGHDQQMAFMRDELMQSLGAETGAESQAARLCVVFINGEYWGLHYLKEKEDAEFVGYYGDRPADEIDYLEGYATAKAGDLLHYQTMIEFVRTNNLTEPAIYERVQAMMETANYIDYKATEIFNYRWDIGNHRLWRPRIPEGRWRWLQFDNDVGWGGFWAELPGWQYNMLVADLTPTGSLHDHNNETTTFLLRRLIQNPEFKRDFINRFADLMNTTLASPNTLARVNQFAAALEPEMTEHIQRWRAPASLSAWRSEVDRLRNYSANRPGYVRQHLISYFKLGAAVPVSLAVASTGANTVAPGVLKINSLTITNVPAARWSGLYFKGHPIQVSAWPRAGFRFKGWEGIYGVETNSMTLLLAGDLSLTALFEPEPSAPPRFEKISIEQAGSVRLILTGQTGQSWELQRSANLIQWTSLGSVLFTLEGKAEILQPLEPHQRAVFYRLTVR